MKAGQNNPEKFIWDSMRSTSVVGAASSQGKALPKLMVWLILFVSATYVVYALKLVSTSHTAAAACGGEDLFSNRHPQTVRLAEPTAGNDTIATAAAVSSKTLTTTPPPPPQLNDRTGVEHIVFGIAASAKLWEKRSGGAAVEMMVVRRRWREMVVRWRWREMVARRQWREMVRRRWREMVVRRRWREMVVAVV